MWQVDFIIAVERERERQRELEQRRALRDAARLDAPAGAGGSPLRRLVVLGRRLAAAVGTAAGSVLDRPAIGPHHL
jgi:hypothetical protein